MTIAVEIAEKFSTLALFHVYIILMGSRILDSVRFRIIITIMNSIRDLV